MQVCVCQHTHSETGYSRHTEAERFTLVYITLLLLDLPKR